MRTDRPRLVRSFLYIWNETLQCRLGRRGVRFTLRSVGPEPRFLTLAGTAPAPPCSGTARPMPVSPRSSHGCPLRHPQDNVLAQRSNATSIYRLSRRLIDLRRKRPALSLGGYGS